MTGVDKIYTIPHPVAPTKDDAADYIKRLSTGHMCLHLPATFDEYFNSLNKTARYEWRKAHNSGHIAVWVTEPQAEDIAAIWHSWTIKQGRPINNTIISPCLRLGVWEIGARWPFSYYPDTQGFIDMVEVRNEDDVTVAYVEIVSHNETAMVSSTLGHAKHLTKGVMKFAFIEVVRKLIERGLRKFYYMKAYYIKEHPERGHFVYDLGFEVEECA